MPLQELLHELWVFQNKFWKRVLLASEFLGVLQCAFQDEPSDWIDVNGGCFTSQAHSFERNCSSSRKWVQNFGCLAPVGLTNFLSKPLKIGIRLSPPMKNAPDSLRLEAFDDFSSRQFPLFGLLDDCAC